MTSHGMGMVNMDSFVHARRNSRHDYKICLGDYTICEIHIYVSEQRTFSSLIFFFGGGRCLHGCSNFKQLLNRVSSFVSARTATGASDPDLADLEGTPPLVPRGGAGPAGPRRSSHGRKRQGGNDKRYLKIQKKTKILHK